MRMRVPTAGWRAGSYGRVGPAGRAHCRLQHLHRGGFLVRILVLVGAPRSRTGPFFRLPGRGGAPLGGPATKWAGWPGEARGSRGGAPGGAALAFARGVPAEISG
jgi:hypothetical protein